MSSKYDDLEKLRDLYAKGIITESEFNSEKERILNGTVGNEMNAQNVATVTNDNRSYNALMHLSQFSNYLFPFLGIIVPIVMWATRKEESESVDVNGKIILNWTISMFIYGVFAVIIFLIAGGISIFSFIPWSEMETYDAVPVGPLAGLFGSVAVLILPLLIFIVLDFIFTIIGAIKASNGEVWNYPLSIRFFKTNKSHCSSTF